MQRDQYQCTRFRNGNMNIRFTPENIETIRNGRISGIGILSQILNDADCDFIGEEFCLSNYDMGCLIYSSYFDKVYILVFSDIEQVLMQGKTLKLYSKIPDETDRDLIRQWYGE